MSIEDNKAFVRRFFSELNQGNLNAADEYLAPDYVAHYGGVPVPIQGRDAWKGLMSGYFAAFPDWHETIEDLIAEGDRVTVRVASGGTHRRDFMGIPASGKQVASTGIVILRLADNRLVEEWGEFDTIGLLQQLGALPPPGPASS